MGHILMDETPTFRLDGHTDVPGRLLHKFFRTFPYTPLFVVGNGERIQF